jgi:peptidoglycan/LPS O-acetylase OafA/YrhL
MNVQSSGKLPHLEGLRGLAALWVVVAHLFVMFRLPIALHGEALSSDPGDRLLEELGKLPRDGHLPVFVFWFLSALVISLRIHKPTEPDPSAYVRQAALKRYFRLTFPLAAASLVSFALMKANAYDHHWLASQSDLTDHPEWLRRWFNFEPGWWNYFKVTFADVYLIQNSNYDFPLWTISPELFGPLLVFAVFFLFHPVRWREWIYVVLLAAMFVGALSEDAYSYYFMFMGGYLFAYYHQHPKKVPARSVLTSGPFAWSLLAFAFLIPVLLSLPKALDTFMRFPLRAISLTMVVTNTAWVRTILSFRPIAFLGSISFSLYLIHIPVLFSLGIYLAKTLVQPGQFHPVALCALLLAVLFACSYLFFRFIDLPSQRFASRFARMASGSEPTTPHPSH